MSSRIPFFFPILVVIAAAPSSMVRADLATIYFKDGKTQPSDRGAWQIGQSGSLKAPARRLRTFRPALPPPRCLHWLRAWCG